MSEDRSSNLWQVLSLKGNHLRNLGCQKVFKALAQNNQTLVELDLESTAIGDPAGLVSDSFLFLKRKSRPVSSLVSCLSDPRFIVILFNQSITDLFFSGRVGRPVFVHMTDFRGGLM